MALQNAPLPRITNKLLNRWSLALITVTSLLIAAFTVLAINGYHQVQDLTAAKDDMSWIISQISYEHERLHHAAEVSHHAAEVSAVPAQLRLRGDIYLSRVDLLRKAPAFGELRNTTSQEALARLYQSAEMTDALINEATTPEGLQALLTKLRQDSDLVRQTIAQISRENYRIASRSLADHAQDVQNYIMAFGLLLLAVIGLSISGVIVSRRNMQLEAQRNRAEDSSRMKSQFLSNMSHEIRTPLNGIIGTLQLIEDVSLSPGNKESISIVRRSARSLLEIVNNILDISKIESGKQTILAQWFDTRILVADVVSHNAGLIGERDIDLLVHCDDDLPREMCSDRLKLEQVLNNLLSNALKFTEAGSVTLHVRKSDARSLNSEGKDSIEFVVTDTGIGISEEDQAKLFEPFGQIDNSLTRKYRGTGLGLSIARDLIVSLGGKITLDSKLGNGTSIKVVIPKALAKASESAGECNEITPDESPEVVLIGEYSTTFRATLTLRELGKTVKIIRSEEDAEAFLKSPPASLRALVVDRRLGGDAIAWLNHLAEANGLPMDLPMIVLRGTRMHPPRTTTLPIFEVEERFSPSNFLDVLREAAPALGLPSSPAEPQGLALDDKVTEVIERTRVLVVDDNSINRRVLVRLLKNAGVASAESVSSARDALKRIEQEQFDLVFMDLQMPEVDGYTAARMIRDRGYSDIKIFACSAHAFESDVQRSVDEGLDGHISKPIEAGELMALLKEAVQPPDQAALN